MIRSILIVLALAVSASAGIMNGGGSSGGGGAPTGAAGGDLTGTYPNPTVGTLSNTIPSATIANLSASTITVAHVGAGFATVTVSSGNILINGTGPAIPFQIGVSSLTVDSNGDLTVASSVTASAFFGDGSHLSGVSGGFSGGNVANVTTFQSSVTVNGNIGTSSAYGITAGNSTSTITPCGMLFYISSNTTGANVGVTTATVGSAATYFSTYTITAGTLVNPGDRLLIECAYANSSVAVGTPVQIIYGLFNSVQYTLTTSNVTTASIATDLKAEVTLFQSGGVEWFNYGIQNNGFNGGAALPTALETGYSLGYIQQPFTQSSSQTAYCAGSRASGGTVNFLWMRVSKACQ